MADGAAPTVDRVDFQLLDRPSQRCQELALDWGQEDRSVLLSVSPVILYPTPDGRTASPENWFSSGWVKPRIGRTSIRERP